MNNIQTKQRDVSLDIAKGMCITLVVVGHTYFSDWAVVFISLFHMPVFFFISGVCLSDRYLDNPKTGIMKKLRGYYWPFVKWNIIFILLHNLFVHAHLIDQQVYSWRDITMKMVRAVTMTGGETLIGQFWFLISLTWAAVGTIVVLSTIKKYKTLSVGIMGGVILTALLIASTEHLSPLWIPHQLGSQTFLALAFFASGYMYKKLRLHTNKVLARIWPVLFVPALIWSFLTDRMDMAVAQSFAWLYYLEALCATLGFLQLARTIKIKWVVSLFNYIGSKTLYILTFHILAFKIVTFAWIKLHEMPIEKLSTIYPLKGVNPWLWIVYVFVGIAVSLAIWEIKETILRRFKRSINK